MTTPLTATAMVENLIAATDLEIAERNSVKAERRLTLDETLRLHILEGSRRPTLVEVLDALKAAGIA
jgi:hypothetical protein